MTAVTSVQRPQECVALKEFEMECRMKAEPNLRQEECSRKLAAYQKQQFQEPEMNWAVPWGLTWWTKEDQDQHQTQSPKISKGKADRAQKEQQDSVVGIWKANASTV